MSSPHTPTYHHHHSASTSKSQPHKSLLLLVVVLLASFCCSVVNGDDASTPANFAITQKPTTSVSSAATDDLKFLNQFEISADAGGKLTAIDVLALDLPGQVFISYGKKQKSASESLLGDIKVYASTEALATAVIVTSERAVKGSKLVVSSANSSANSSDISVLTEIVLFKQSALKKVLASGAADVVISNHVLFTKKKEDYSFFDGKKRSLRATASSAATGGVTIQELSSQNITYGPRTVLESSWMISPADSSTVYDPIALNIDASGPGYVVLNRIDGDLLPKGSIGTIFAHGGQAEVIGAQDTLHVQVLTENSIATMYLSSTVNVKSVSTNTTSGASPRLSNNLNLTRSDDSLSVLLNGTGNLFVSAKDSAVYVSNAEFKVLGTGFMQAWFKEIFAEHSVLAINGEFGTMEGYPDNGGVQAFFIKYPKVCMTSKYGTTIGTSGETEQASAPCPVYAVPKKNGYAIVPGAEVSVSSAAASAGGGIGAGRALWSAALGVALVAFSAL